MANSSLKPKKVRRHSPAVTVFNILFLIAAVCIVVWGVLMFTPAKSSIKAWLQSMDWLKARVPAIKNWVNYHICQNYHCATALPGHGVAFTCAFYLLLGSICALGYLFLIYIIFLVMGKNKRVGRTQAWRKVFEWILFVIVLLCAAATASTLWKQRSIKVFGPAYTWMLNVARSFADLFKEGGALTILRFGGHTNPYIFALFYFCLIVALFEIVVLLICRFAGKPKKAKEAIPSLAGKEEEEEEKKPEETPALQAPVPAYSEATEAAPVKEEEEKKPEAAVAATSPVAAVSTKEVTKATSERVLPTVRELALLNSLEPLKPSRIAALPGIYPTEEEKIINDLEPFHEKAVIKEENKEDSALAKSLSPEEAKVQVLPAVDEWGADPWDEEEKPVEEEKPIEEKTIEETPAPKEDITETAKPEEETAPVLEEVKEPVEEPKPLEEAPKEEKPIKTPVEEEKPAEEEKPFNPNDLKADYGRAEKENPYSFEATGEDRSDVKSVVADNEHEPLTTEPRPENTWVLPPYVPEEKPVEEAKPIEETKPVEEVKPVEAPKEEAKPVEEVKPAETPKEEEKPVEAPVEEKPVEEEKPLNPNDIKAEVGRKEQANPYSYQATGEDRSELKSVQNNNEHEEIKTEARPENTWVLPPYVPEEKPVEAPKPVEANKPMATPNVKQMVLKPVNLGVHANKPHGPIGVVAPMAHKEEEPKPVVQEEKKLAPVSGPLHSTAKSKHEKIEAVKARHVAFELKNYQVRTYQGDLTPEQAFALGAMKVQPKVRPTFANESNEPTWKAKRREEDIRKNGYSNITQVEDLNGAKPSVPKPVTSTKATSIRDMVKERQLAAEEAKKAAQEKPTSEEKKPLKPIKPIKPVSASTTTKPSEPETKKDEIPQPKEFFHPIAPIAKKPNKRPEIKPIDPNQRKKQ
jgi:hypothetical protein